MEKDDRRVDDPNLDFSVTYVKPEGLQLVRECVDGECPAERLRFFEDVSRQIGMSGAADLSGVAMLRKGNT